MKKLLSVVFVLSLILSMLTFAGCGKKAENLKLGLGVHSYIEEITNADGETNGKGNAVTTAAAVLIDSNGRIVKCAIDTTDNEQAFTSKGNAVAAGELLTKYEAGENYGMKKYGNAAKEWFEQVDSFISVVVGKNLPEIKALKNSDNKGNEEVTKAGCTIDIADFVIALEKAVNNAADSNAQATDTLKVGFVSTQTENKDASEEAEGLNSIDTTIVAIAANDKGDVSAASVDAVTTEVKFDTKGVSNSEYGVSISSKKTQGNDYKMAEYGQDLNGDGVVKEWYEQADVFATQLVGNKTTDISSLADAKGYGVETVQKAGCTINVNDMIKAAVKATTAK